MTLGARGVSRQLSLQEIIRPVMPRADELFARLSAGGETAVDELIADFQSENLWIDFKRSADDAGGTKLAKGDRENLAKAISGFGNSDGGIIVWGVDCTRDPKSGADLPTSKRPLAYPERFVSWLEGAVSSCTAPPHRNVEHVAIRRSQSNEGFVVTFIPSSLHAPHQCVQPTNDLRYYMRVGSTFSSVPHAVLSGLFGRRPQPALSLWWLASTVKMVNDTLVVRALVSTRNVGRSIARDLYFNLWTYPPGSASSITFEDVSDAVWEVFKNAANFWNLVSRERVRLAPGAPMSVGVVAIHIRPPFTATYSIDVSYGCEGSEVRQRRTDLSPVDLASLYSTAPSVLDTPGGPENIVNVLLKPGA